MEKKECEAQMHSMPSVRQAVGVLGPAPLRTPSTAHSLSAPGSSLPPGLPSPSQGAQPAQSTSGPLHVLFLLTGKLSPLVLMCLASVPLLSEAFPDHPKLWGQQLFSAPLCITPETVVLIYEPEVKW